MVSHKKILVLDLGMQSLRVAEFLVVEGGTIKLLRGARRELLMDPSLEQSRPDQIRQSLLEILGEWKIRSAETVCILPAHSVFTRVVPLDIPAGDADQIKDLIGFEAQQNIPFPLEEVVWDYVSMGQNPAGAVNVAFVAVKTDLLESLCNAVGLAGLKIVGISVAPLALLDAFRNCYPECADSTSLLLDIGSRTSNMVIASPGSFFSRNIPSGGLAVTSAIAKELHVEPELAEQLKITRGSVSLGAGFEAPEDPVEANLARMARQTLLKTQADISRSLSYYRTAMGGTEPNLFLLTGGMASLPYLAEFFSEKLQKEVSFFEPLRGVAHAEPATLFLEANPNNLGELIGGAFQQSNAPHTTVDLFPPFLKRKRELSKRLPYLATVGVLLLVTLFSWYAFALHATRVTLEKTGNLSNQLKDTTILAEGIQQTQSKIEANQKTGEAFLALVQLREAYPDILAELSSKIPDRFLWITEILPAGESPQKGVSPKTQDAILKTLVIKGLYLDNPRQAAVIDDFVNALQSSTIFAFDEKEKSKIITQRGSPSGDYWAYPFSLRIPLRNPVTPLP